MELEPEMTLALVFAIGALAAIVLFSSIIYWMFFTDDDTAN
jgi:hypothetical protein